jgi:hypothetical protein
MLIRRRKPALPVLTVIAAALSCALLLPTAASARRSEAGSRLHPRAGASEPAPGSESSATSEAPGTSEPPTPPSDESSGPAAPQSPRQQLRSEGPRGCHTTAEASATHIAAGESVTLSGIVSCASGSPAEMTVTLSERASARSLASALSAPASTEASATGAYQLTSGAISSNCVLLVQTPSGHGARVAIKVTPTVTLSPPIAASGTVARRSTAVRKLWTFSGTVDPAATGARVVLQRESAGSGERWHLLALGNVQADGSFSISHHVKANGAIRIRAIVHVKGDLAAASEAVALEEARAQNPQLTIATSLDPSLPAQQVTISGVAAGAAGQQVTLLARTHGQVFASIAQTLTGDSGEYSFAVSPSQSTDYRVSDSSTASIVLAQRVRFALTVNEPPSTLAAGTELTVSGEAIAAPAGTVVRLELQRASGVSFRPVAVGSVSAGGVYSISYTPASVGANVLRVSIAASSEHADVTSEPFTVTTK